MNIGPAKMGVTDMTEKLKEDIVKDWRNEISLILGGWLIIAPYVLEFSNHPTANRTSALIGFALLLLAAMDDRGPYMWKDMTGFVLGIVLISTPWIRDFAALTYAFGSPAFNATVNFIVVGAVVCVCEAVGEPPEREGADKDLSIRNR